MRGANLFCRRVPGGKLAKAARALAILHTAIYDAVNGIAQTHERYLVPGKPAGAASSEAAVSAAANGLNWSR